MMTCFILTLVYLSSAAEATYFTMTNITMNIPGDRTKYPPIDHAILTLYALKGTEIYKANPEIYTINREEHFRYSINLHGERLLQIFPSTGDIMFKREFFEHVPDVENITFHATVEDSAGMKNITTIQLNISPRSPLDCDFVTQDLCYWQSATYRIYENSKPSIIGSLSSPYLAEMCPEHKLNYTLLRGGNQFALPTPSDSNKSWTIRSRKSLDRDVDRWMEPFNRKSPKSGEYRTLSVKCTVEDPSGTIREILKDIPVKILDEDDNPPIPQTKDDVLVVRLHSNLVEKNKEVGHSDLIFIDRDSPPVNKYNFKILEDYLNVLDPNCSKHEDDRHAESQTVIHCKLIFTKDMQIPVSPYAVTLEINDTTLLPGFGNSLVHVPIRIYFENYQDFPQPFSQTLPPNERNRPLLLYPSREVTIFNTAARYSRVTQPPKESLKKEIKSFAIRSDSSNGAFNITNPEGIVFVENASLLRIAASVRLTIQWKNKELIQSDEILVKIFNEPNRTCVNELIKNEWDFCSKSKSKKDCNKRCGLSTGGTPSYERRKYNGNERCMWRGDENPGPFDTHLYATCTPDIKTCPDGICDALEDLNPLICPQDCLEDIHFPLSKNRKTGRGFDIGAGVCYCTKLPQCFCEHITELKRKTKGKTSTTEAPTTPTVLSNNSYQNNQSTSNNNNTSVPIVVQPNVSRHVEELHKDSQKKRGGGEIAKCGTTCILGIAGSALFLLVVVGGMMFCWKLDRVHKAVRQKFTNETPDLSVPLSDYVDRAAPPDTLHFNFDVTTMITNQMNTTAPDPKWEFPRSKLSIEQTLGEGEFGRVLRAKALQIAGQPGYTTVAVKTLKDDAGERELADLLSEYQLLKEVSHPNIIRLLGASTLPGGPVYLIIEFAEHGSLRNYLRRSRHLQAESRITANRIDNIQQTQMHEPYDEPKICQITPKDILSFAWQIANGMSYLSDIKLVHRDLAARNVLVAAEKICKISDFGLTRDVYEDDAYLKRSKGRVPVKWMAPESLSDHIYTNKSDVWGYGILIWELVTLGASPYPGIAVQSLFHLLKTGYRMERPQICSLALYKVMRSCWHNDPEKRPTFSDLSLKFERMLSDEVQYLDLTGNAVNNRGYFCDTFDDPEVEVENEENDRKTNTDAINYLNKTMDYEKCGNATKIEIPNEENVTLLNPPPLNDNQNNNMGYETPVKVQNQIKPEEVTTPLNEFPQYGYTDMTACKSK